MQPSFKFVNQAPTPSVSWSMGRGGRLNLGLGVRQRIALIRLSLPVQFAHATLGLVPILDFRN